MDEDTTEMQLPKRCLENLFFWAVYVLKFNNFTLMVQFIQYRNRKFYLVFLAALFMFINCKKDDSNIVDNTNTTAPKNFLPITAGSTFSYHSVTLTDSSDYTLTATTGDSLVNGKKYFKFIGSDGITRYRYRAGVNYFQVASLPSLPGSPIFEENYLNDSLPVNATWTGQFQFTNPLGIPPQLYGIAMYKIVEKGISYVVNGKAFKDVIHVRLTDVSGYGSLTDPPLIINVANGDFYYALGIGLIQSSLYVPDNPSFGIMEYSKVEKLTSYSVK